MSPEIDIRPPFTPCAIGIDSLYVGYFLDGIGIDWDRLRYEKEKLRADPAASHAEIALGGELFALRRGAQRPYSLALSNKAFTLQLGERIAPRRYVQFSSHLLWTSGLHAALRRFRAIWDRAGSKQTRRETVSRVDGAFDFEVGAPAFRVEDFVSQADKDATWRAHQTPQSFQFGRSDVVCRVYDKVAEIEEQSEKTWLYDIWGTRKGVWRAEFQVRGDRLKEAGIGTLDQMQAYLPGLVRHLARHHTSLRTPSQDTNRSRWPLHPMWRGVIETADQLTKAPERPPPPLRTGSEYRLARQTRSVFGHLNGIAATLSEGRAANPVTFEELLGRLGYLLDRYHSPQIWQADVSAKLRKRALGL
ncbi:MAG TPA: hypothetical protein VHU87_13095 [Rhizomicrobium sp.]|nr:hypothetical protein [Rhizomicrobium sp.]